MSKRWFWMAVLASTLATWGCDSVPLEPEDSPELCRDGLDNDGDGLADCDDLDCTLAGVLCGVGDSCVVESVPAGGLDPDEQYVEVASVQCRTRVCLSDGFGGDPRLVEGSEECEELPERCVSQEDVEQRMHCTCRCGLDPEGPPSPSPLCECPSDFVCHLFEWAPQAGAGIRGAYCVRPENHPESQ